MDNTVDRDWKKWDKGMSDRLRGLFAVWLRQKDCQAGKSICAHPARTLVWAAVNRRRTLLVWHQQQFRVVTAIKHFRKHNALPRKQFVGNVSCKNNLQILQSVWLLHEERFANTTCPVHTFSRFKNFCFGICNNQRQQEFFYTDAYLGI